MAVYDPNDFHMRARVALFTRWPVADSPSAHAPARRQAPDRARQDEAARRVFYARRAYRAARNRRAR